jgi:2-keto-4-pentenoate hydratase/2-oxohepta-3-ene-1,7-dioic acid hydratase in catechol pathway
MKICCFESSAGPAGARNLGVVAGNEVADVRAVAPQLSPNAVDILSAGREGLDALAAALKTAPRLPLSSVRLRAPVSRPGKILGIGLNYRAHAAETGREPPSVQTWFNKQATSINDPGGDVMMPAVSEALDYEVELVVVIGRRGRHVPRSRAHEIIGGYMVGCDYSVRDWQRATPTMIMGKGFDTHGPAGPWITTPDEAGDIASLKLTCHVNGEQRQNAICGDMIFDVPAQIEHLTKAFTLEPGDLIFTGTPAGVAAARQPPIFLKVGDRVRCEIGGLGFIEQTIGKESGETRIG